MEKYVTQYNHIAELKQITTQLNEANQQIDRLQTSAGQASNGGGSSTIDLNETTIIRVCQRIKEEIIDDCDPNDPFGDAMDTNNNLDDSQLGLTEHRETQCLVLP